MMPELLHIDGKPFVLVPMHEYRKLTASSAAPEPDLDPAILDQLAAAQSHPVKILRKHRGLTQSELAEAAGLSRPYLTEIETGKKTGSIGAIRALANILRVDVGVLVPAGA